MAFCSCGLRSIGLARRALGTESNSNKYYRGSFQFGFGLLRVPAIQGSRSHFGCKPHLAGHSLTMAFRALLLVASLLFAPVSADAETVCVKYGPCPLDLSLFACTDTPRSSFVRRGCYDAAKRFMAIELNATWYPYCSVDAASVKTYLASRLART